MNNYWLTTHWPPLISQKEKNQVFSEVFAPSDRGIAGKNLDAGDKILIYQSATGPTVIKKELNGKEHYDYSMDGKQGIVAIVEATSRLLEYPEQEITKYLRRTPIKWSWYADTKTLSQNGFVSRESVNKILGYKPNYNFHGFGDLHSGLKNLQRNQFELLVEEFKKGAEFKERKYNKSRFGQGESPEHLELKEYVSNFPSEALNEEDITFFAQEYEYPTKDKCDVILRDHWGRYVAIEIEIAQNELNFEGMLQAIKYRYMLAAMMQIPFSEVRSMLIAYKITDELKITCEKYDVEWRIIDRNELRK